VLETAAADSSRLILTGQAQSQGLNQAAFKTAVCGKIFGLLDCANGVYVDVQKFSAFGSVSIPTRLMPTATSSTISAITQVVPATSWSFACSINGRSTFSLLGFNLQNMSGGKRLLIATAAFRNEPYGP